ncbi:MAG: NAD-dependent epimerase/dehydratase family protein [Armatimonadetes bacterium]|nr:NAD-dependent epimerase/dehydratase family protein [Armatimonadota bacterium]
MKLLIIGGTGLISTPLTRQLGERGHDVTLYNRGRRDAPLPDGVNVIHGDRTQHASFEAQLREREPFDCVIDMICYEPEDAQSLVRAFAGRVGHLIVCSTVDVYEKPQRRLLLTEETPHHPAPWDYAVKKAQLEEILWESSARGDFPLTVFRPGHSYNDGGALHHTLGSRTSYLDRIWKGKPIIVHGDGSSIWAACHAVDVAGAFTAAAGNEIAYNTAYNVAGEEWLTWNRYHRLVAEAIGAPEPTLVHIPTDLLIQLTDRAYITSINFQYNNAVDNTAAKRDLGFRYTVPFVEGARRIYTTLKERGQIANSDEDPLDDQIITLWERVTSQMMEDMGKLGS